MHPKFISISDYDYPLEAHQIAQFPLEQRDASKLLVMKGGNIADDVFRNIGRHLPLDALLVTNKTKVVNARLHFVKPQGASIEIFCLEPAQHKGNFERVFSAPSPVEWNCLVGNSKRWKSGLLSLRLEGGEHKTMLLAERIAQFESHSLVRFSWDNPELTFGRILELAGELPLPPYINRKAESLDYERYQTVFAQAEGSVAAPTAGLHFTSELIESLKSQDIQFAELTLHVGAGTFRPVSSALVGEHQMHEERIVVGRSLIEQLRGQRYTRIAVGTTSMRTLESLYWLGVQMRDDLSERQLNVGQWEPYDHAKTWPNTEAALDALLKYMDRHGMQMLTAQTALMIVPGYSFRVVDGLITNFHQPKSTLLLLVSAFVGDDWRKAYDYALSHNFRFLSYGDSCLFLP